MADTTNELPYLPTYLSMNSKTAGAMLCLIITEFFPSALDHSFDQSVLKCGQRVRKINECAFNSFISGSSPANMVTSQLSLLSSNWLRSLDKSLSKSLV